MLSRGCFSKHPVRLNHGHFRALEGVRTRIDRHGQDTGHGPQELWGSQGSIDLSVSPEGNRWVFLLPEGLRAQKLAVGLSSCPQLSSTGSRRWLPLGPVSARARGAGWSSQASFLSAAPSRSHAPFTKVAQPPAQISFYFVLNFPFLLLSHPVSLIFSSFPSPLLCRVPSQMQTAGLPASPLHPFGSAQLARARREAADLSVHSATRSTRSFNPKDRSRQHPWGHRGCVQTQRCAGESSLLSRSPSQQQAPNELCFASPQCPLLSMPLLKAPFFPPGLAPFRQLKTPQVSLLKISR